MENAALMSMMHGLGYDFDCPPMVNQIRACADGTESRLPPGYHFIVK